MIPPPAVPAAAIPSRLAKDLTGALLVGIDDPGLQKGTKVRFENSVAVSIGLETLI